MRARPPGRQDIVSIESIARGYRRQEGPGGAGGGYACTWRFRPVARSFSARASAATCWVEAIVSWVAM